MKKVIVTSFGLLPLLAHALTTEQTNSAGALRIRADYAWSVGATGNGVTVAVLDTGVFRHTEFSGRLLTGATFVSGTTSSNDDNGHGTHVAGIIAAASNGVGMQGVAYKAYILPVKVLDSRGSGWSTAFNQGMAYTKGRARIINLSLGSSGYFGEPGMRTAVANGQLIVAAAGNSGQANPAWPARYAKEAWAKGQVIAVGAVDANNNIASFSNRAGDTARWYLVAPGTSILSTYNNGGYAYMSGTSMATPMVSGAAAAVMSYWPHLGSAQVADILFRTATDLGAPGIDAIYGRGLVNLQRALQPVGTLTVNTQGTTRTVSGSSLAAGGTPYAAALRQAAQAGSFKVVSTDDYGRGFETDLGQAVKTTSTPFVERMLNGMEAHQGLAERTVGNARFAVRYTARTAQPDSGFGPAHFAQPTLGALSYQQKYANGTETAIGWGGMAQRFFGLSATGMTPAGFAGERFALPYFDVMPDVAHIGYGWALTDRTRLRMGFASSQPGMMTRLGATPTDPGLPKPDTGASMMLAEAEKSFDGGVLTLSVGRLREKSSLLGSISAQALELAAAPATTFVSLGSAHHVARDTYVSAIASIGRSAGFTNNSVISGVSEMTTASWSLGLTRRNAWREKDAVGLSLSMPMKPLSGTMGIVAPVAQNLDGSLVSGTQRVSLVPTATEVVGELSYSTPVGKAGSLAGALAYRRHPGHDANAPAERAIGVRYQLSF